MVVAAPAVVVCVVAAVVSLPVGAACQAFSYCLNLLLSFSLYCSRRLGYGKFYDSMCCSTAIGARMKRNNNEIKKREEM